MCKPRKWVYKILHQKKLPFFYATSYRVSKKLWNEVWLKRIFNTSFTNDQRKLLGHFQVWTRFEASETTDTIPWERSFDKRALSKFPLPPKTNWPTNCVHLGLKRIEIYPSSTFVQIIFSNLKIHRTAGVGENEAAAGQAANVRPNPPEIKNTR